MFESAVLERAGVRSGLVFVTTDHGFNLGHRPSGSDLVIARLRRDGHDHALWERLGRPPAYRYLYDPWTRGAVPSLEPYLPPPSTRFEAEAQWPVLSIGGGYAMPDFPGGDCKSGGAALRLAPAPGPVDARFEVLAATPGRYRLIAGWVASHGAEVEIRAGASRVFARPGPGCFQMVGPIVDLGTAPLIVDIRVSESTGWLDYLELGSATSAHPSPGGSGKKR